MEVSVRLQALGNGSVLRGSGVLLAAGLLAISCGRSAPEGAFTELDPADEPASAGVQATSESSVVAPVVTSTTATTAPPAPAMEAAGSYVVEPGDTLSVIAEQFGITTDALSAANNITDVDTIRPGQELIIPAPAG
jgi:LysM repeat protein